MLNEMKKARELPDRERVLDTMTDLLMHLRSLKAAGPAALLEFTDDLKDMVVEKCRDSVVRCLEAEAWAGACAWVGLIDTEAPPGVCNVALGAALAMCSAVEYVKYDGAREDVLTKCIQMFPDGRARPVDAPVARRQDMV